MDTKQIVIIGIVIFAIIIMVIVLISKKKKERYTKVPTIIDTTNNSKKIKNTDSKISANWIMGKPDGTPIFNDIQYLPNKKPKIGIAISGGGARSASSAWGVFQVLQQLGLLNTNVISHISSSSGAAWIVNSILYQPLQGNLTNLDDILGKYISPSQIQFSNKINFPLFGYNIVNSNYPITLDNKWWCNATGESFLKPYGLYSDTQKAIVGMTKNDILPVLNKLGNSYFGIIKRDNVPIPISLQTINYKYSTSNIFNYKSPSWMIIPSDSTPSDSGFLTTQMNITIPAPYNQSTITKFGGRVTTYAFNSEIFNSPKQLKPGNNPITVKLEDDVWDLTQIAGSASMAPGLDILKMNLPLIDHLIPYYTVQTPGISPQNSTLFMSDGGNWDNTSATSLLARKCPNIIVYNFCSGQYGSPDDIDQIANLFGLPSWNSVYHDVSACQVLSNNNGEYQKTLNGIRNNMNTYGVPYYADTYDTVTNKICGVVPYKVKILWITLAPCPAYITQLSSANQKIINNIKGWPNICTAQEYLFDCNANPQCPSGCLTPTESLLQMKTTNKTTDAESLSLCNLNAWITQVVTVPYIQGKPINLPKITEQDKLKTPGFKKFMTYLSKNKQ